MLPQKYICPLVLILSVLFVQVGDMSEQTHLKATEVSRYVDGEQLRCGESCSLFTTLCFGLNLRFTLYEVLAFKNIRGR